MADGPRAVDPIAGLVRFADPKLDIPIASLRAVAIVFTERLQRISQGRRRVTVTVLMHSVVLVPRQARPDVVTLLDALEAGSAPPPGFSIRGAAISVDDASIHFFKIGNAAAARRQAKAVARAANLPMLELYGEYPVWRPAGRLDLSLRERLAGRAPPAAPGPPPPGLLARPVPGGLELAVSYPPRSIKLWMFPVAGAVAVSVPLALVEPLLLIATLSVALATLIYAFRQRRRPEARLQVVDDTLRWFDGGHGARLEVGQLEMMRVNEATLVLISHDDEVRCDLGTEEAALWARQALEHHLLTPSAGAYR